MLLLIAVFVSVLLPKNTNVYADYSHSYYITGYLSGPVGDGILEEGGYYSFDTDRVINASGNYDLINEYHNDPDPYIYLTNTENSADKYLLYDDEEGIVKFYLPFDTVGNTYYFVFEFGDGYNFYSDVFTIVATDRASIDTAKKQLP